MVCTTKSKNLRAWVVQCSVHSKLNAAELVKIIDAQMVYIYIFILGFSIFYAQLAIGKYSHI